MDSALLLRMKFDKTEYLLDKEVTSLLSESKIIERLTKDYEENNFFNIFRLLCLSEIPFADRLPYTQKVTSYVSNHLALEDGFSYTGKTDNIVPCYNAMLLESYVRLGKSNSQEVQNALNWIKRYQVFGRNQSTSWSYKGICNHGGCMNATPCYIGIGKTIRALITYAKFTNHEDEEVEKMIDVGVSYMLQHNLFQRLSNQSPISAHITDIMFPQAYMLTITDLVYIAGEKGLWNCLESQELRKLLLKKSCEKNSWKIDYIYSHKGYKAFDGKRRPSEWINYLFNSSLKPDE